MKKMGSDSILCKSGIFCQILADFATNTFVGCADYPIREKERKQESERGGKKERKTSG